MLTPDHKGAPRALEQAIAAERAKLVSAHAVQKSLYQVLLYAEGEDAVVHAEAAQVVASLMEDAVDKHRANGLVPFARCHPETGAAASTVTSYHGGQDDEEARA
jgi:hypothetical protein